MSGNFNFNAPQFFDFSLNGKIVDDDKADAYFETEHEEDPLYITANVFDENSPRESVNSNNDFETGSTHEYETNRDLNKDLKESLHKIHSVSVEDFFGVHERKDERKKRRTHINDLAKPKSYASVENLNTATFVSSAEYINKLQNKTPVRFRSKPASYVPNFNKSKLPKQTIPCSPALMTKQRCRPVSVLSTKELEEKEYQEQKKFQIKAKPVNKKVLQGPLKGPVVAKKPVTKVEPFNITTPKKKEVIVPEEHHEFHAQPLPKTTFDKPKPTLKPPMFTQPQGPKFLETYLKKQAKEQEKDQKQKPNEALKPTRTIPKPFSFLEREESKKMRSEMQLKKFLKEAEEQEKKSREFHARPLPRWKSTGAISKNSKNTSTESVKSQGKSEPDAPVIFKARPATVLHKEPFIPKKNENHYVLVNEFQLHSERRAAEREEYDRKLKEKEDYINQRKQLEEEKRLQEEEEERAQLRKAAEYKAKPIIKYKEVKIVPSNKVTTPISPTFLTDNFRNKDNISNQDLDKLNKPLKEMSITNNRNEIIQKENVNNNISG